MAKALALARQSPVAAALRFRTRRASSSTCGAGVFRGLGVSSFRADFDSALFFVLSDVFFAPDFFFAVFGFGVGVWRRFVFGVGDFFGFGVDAARVSVSSD